MQTYSTLYKRDSKGEVRVWFMEQDGERYRTTAGLKDGQLVTSEWTVAQAKNVGRSNETSPEQQAEAEVKSHYKKKLEGEYHENEADIDKARFFAPMLAQPWEKRESKIEFPVYFQPKLDGIRCIANRDGLWTRKGKPIIAVPHIIEALKPLFERNPDLVIDGELYNHALRDDFNEIVSIVRKTKPSDADLAKAREVIEYHVYDMPSCDKGFATRIAALEQLLSTVELYPLVQPVSTLFSVDREKLDQQYGLACQQGYEGGIVRLDTPYEQKRSNSLIKRKDMEDDEFEIVSVLEGTGNWSGCAKTLVIKTKTGHQCEATMSGTMEHCRDILERADQLIGKEATVQFQGYTPAGALRFPSVKVIHEQPRW